MKSNDTPSNVPVPNDFTARGGRTITHLFSTHGADDVDDDDGADGNGDGRIGFSARSYFSTFCVAACAKPSNITNG